jgi:hypothetical protein
VSRLTQDTSYIMNTILYGGITLSALPFQVVPVCIHDNDAGPTTPTMPRHHRFGLFPFRSPLLWESLLFSLPPGTKMFQFSGFASRLASGFQVFSLEGCPIRIPADITDICSSPQLFAACHVLHRL